MKLKQFFAELSECTDLDWVTTGAFRGFVINGDGDGYGYCPISAVYRHIFNQDTCNGSYNFNIKELELKTKVGHLIVYVADGCGELGLRGIIVRNAMRKACGA